MMRFLLPLIWMPAVGVLWLLATEQPATAESDDDAVKVLRKAAETTEIHAIGFTHPEVHGFTPQDVTNWPQLVQLLRQRKGPAERVWQLLSKETQDLILNDAVVTLLDGKEPIGDARALQGDTAHDIKKSLGCSDFYAEKEFKDVPLDKGLRDSIALGSKRNYLQNMQLNRALLAAAFPEQIKPMPVNYQSVSVRVKAGKPVLLVLTSYEACRWMVSIENGGSVAGVVLGGGSPQEVEGVDAPVIYRACRDLNGNQRTGDMLNTAQKKDSKPFIQLEAATKKLLDNTLTHFQGMSHPTKAGITITPSKK